MVVLTLAPTLGLLAERKALTSRAVADGPSGVKPGSVRVPVVFAVVKRMNCPGVHPGPTVLASAPAPPISAQTLDVAPPLFPVATEMARRKPPTPSGSSRVFPLILMMFDPTAPE